MTVAKKISAVVPDQLVEKLELRAEEEGRSLSNLVSFLLELQMHEWEPKGQKPQQKPKN